MSATPNADELYVAAQAMNCSSSDFKASAPARLYVSTGHAWEYTGYSGIVCLTMDPKLSAAFLSFIDLKSKRCVLVQEAYNNFEYKELSPFMHAFEGDSAVYGLNFAESFDAKLFTTTTKGLISICNQPAPAAKTVTKPSSTAAKHETKSSGGGFGAKLTGLFGGKKEEERKRPVISGAKNFVHVSHLGFSGKNGFGDIPPEWKEIFKRAGVSEEELKDKKTAKFIMKTIATADIDLPPLPTQMTPSHQQQATTVSSAPVPPPPPTSSGGGPPPPPPPPGPFKSAPPPPPMAMPTSNSGGAPPPPSRDDYSSHQSTDMLTMIQNTKLKKVTESDIPKLDQMSESQQNTLANKIQQAMNARRTAVVDDSDDSDEDWEI